MKFIDFNPEILSDKPTHIHNGLKVKVFSQTVLFGPASAEIMEGENKGKWTTVLISDLEKVNE